MVNSMSANQYFFSLYFSPQKPGCSRLLDSRGYGNMRTVSLGANLVGLEFKPPPVRELVSEHGDEEDLGDGSGECLVELRLYSDFSLN